MTTTVSLASDESADASGESGPVTDVVTALTSLERRAGHKDPDTNTHSELVSAPTTEGLQTVIKELRRPSAQRIRMLERYAEGGMGSIELVVDKALSRRMAMKVMRPDMQDDVRCLRLFLREARVTAQLEHPNIVPVHDVGEDPDGRLYFTMKLVEGRTLKDILRSVSAPPPSGTELYNMIDTAVRVCDALAFAHSRGVLHCDIKPANIMVGDYGEVYLMDWGIARLTSEHPVAATADSERPDSPGYQTDEAIMGTSSYMSPEQAHGLRDQLDERSDVFQTGALLYEILTQRPPYCASTLRGTLALARAGRFKSVDKALPGASLPRELVRIVAKAMEHKPDDRYQRIEALKDDLVHFLRGGGEFPRAAFSAGEHVIREGELGDTAYIIVNGRVEVYRTVDGQRVSVRVMGPGEVFGETAVLTSQPRNASVVALRPTILYIVSREVLDREVDAMKPWVGSLLRTLARRFRDSEHEAASLSRTLDPEFTNY